MTPNEPRQWERESSTPWCISKGSAVCVLVLSLCVLALSGWSYLSYQRMNELDARMVELGLWKRVNVEQKTTPLILQRENEATIYPDEVIAEEPPPPTEKRREVPLVAVPDKKQPVVPVIEKRREAPLVAVPDKEQPVAPVAEKRREVPLVTVPDKKQPVVPVVEKSLGSPVFNQFKRQCLLQGGGTAEVAEGVEWICPEKWEP